MYIKLRLYGLSLCQRADSRGVMSRVTSKSAGPGAVVAQKARRARKRMPAILSLSKEMTINQVFWNFRSP